MLLVCTAFSSLERKDRTFLEHIRNNQFEQYLFSVYSYCSHNAVKI